MNPAGTGSNEVLSLLDVAERFAIDRRARPDRTVLAVLRRMERDTGRRIVVASGTGRGRRYLVLGRELEAALDGDRRDIDQLAEKVAAAVQRIEDRVIAVSVKVEAMDKRVAEVEKRGQSRLPF